MPMDHYGLIVPSSKFEGIIAFLIESLKHTGFKEWYRPVPHAAGLGDGSPYFWISGFDPENGDTDTQLSVLSRQHIAFSAQSKYQTLYLSLHWTAESMEISHEHDPTVLTDDTLDRPRTSPSIPCCSLESGR